ncbi:glycosyltransferase family 4 protein [Litoricolaceae bacterium]|nr:glycosyltransferase family 4 protein [Litorivicinaceae bacterium]
MKRFGPVGGMETYVWHLAHGLSKRGLLISVVCEQVMGDASPDIDLIQVERSPEKPRWKSMVLFRERVDALLKDCFQGQKIIVHSHERSLSHHVTTFHGPPINAGGNLNWIQKLSPRIRGWMQMEYHELLSLRVQCIIPVSSKIQGALIAEYPDLKGKHFKLGWPGVGPVAEHEAENACDQALVRFVFVGKEWKRKGLPRAIDIFEAFRTTNPNMALDVYGVDLRAVPKQLRKTAGVRFMGWISEIPWSSYNILLHPAENEPFGMVVAEARSHGVAVLMSDRVGAADLAFNNVRVVSIGAPLSEWKSALHELLESPDRASEVKWTWDDLIDLHCQTIYPQLEAETL